MAKNFRASDLLTEEQKRRYTAFWNRTPTDRACLYMFSGDGSHYPWPTSVEQQWTDVEYITNANVFNSAHNRYYAEGYPTHFVNLGPGCLAACIGGTYRLAPSTVWFENQPLFVEEWEGRPHPAYNENAPMSRLIAEMTESTLAHQDSFLTSITDIGGTYDIIAALRGTQNLLMDMLEEPDEVKKLRDEVAPLWKNFYLKYAHKLIDAQGGMTSWIPLWSDRTFYPLQCDYSAMISPQMFGEFILPDLKEQTEYMDRSIYHLDGVGELPHLDQLLALPKLNAIQWVPGAGKPGGGDPCWFDIYRRIQAAGKGLMIVEVGNDQLENIFKNVSQRGLFMILYVRDQKDADEIITMAKKLYH